MSRKTKKAYLRLCPEKRQKKRIWSLKGYYTVEAIKRYGHKTLANLPAI